LWIAKLSDGAFDITVGAFSGLWKFDEDNDGTIPTAAAVHARLSLVNWRDVLVTAKTREVRLRQPGQRITLGGIAKGFVVDAATAVLRRQGFENFLIQCGGDMFAAGLRANRPWRIGIQDPRLPPANVPTHANSIAIVELSNQAFNTSGDYERFVIRGGRRYHHILDPQTGYPVDHTRAVSILARSSFLAETLDTTVFVLGAPRGLALLRHREIADVDGFVVDARNQIHISPGFERKLTQLRPPTDGI
jgi:FAD:protein FMN transferase